MAWTVIFKKDVSKALRKLPIEIQLRVQALANDIVLTGPIRGDWKNYGKLSEIKHHCHVKLGRPTYVVCWRVTDKLMKTVEVYFAGTHEKAPY